MVDGHWGEELQDALRADPSTLRIVSPFIKRGAIERLLALQPAIVQVVTTAGSGWVRRDSTGKASKLRKIEPVNQSATQPDALLDAGDLEGAAVWRKIIKAI